MFQFVQNNLKTRFINLFKGKIISFVIFFIFFNLLNANIFVSHASPEEEAFQNLETLRSSYRQILWEFQDSGPEIKMSPLRKSLEEKSQETLNFILLGRHGQFPFFDFSSVDSKDSKRQQLITEALLEVVLYPSTNMDFSVKYLHKMLKEIKDSQDPQDLTYGDRYLYVFKKLTQAAWGICEWKSILGNDFFKKIIIEEDMEEDDDIETTKTKSDDDDDDEDEDDPRKFLKRTLFNPKSQDLLLIPNFEVALKILQSDCDLFSMAYSRTRPFALMVKNKDFFISNEYSMCLKLGDVSYTFPIPRQERNQVYFFPREDLCKAMESISLSLGERIICSGNDLKRKFEKNKFEMILSIPFKKEEKKHLLDYGFIPSIIFPYDYSESIDWTYLSGEPSIRRDNSLNSIFKDDSISLHPLNKGSVYSSENPDSSSLEKRFAQTLFPKLERIDFDGLSSQELVPTILRYIAEGVKEGHYPSLYQIKSGFMENLLEYPELSSIAFCSSHQVDPQQYSLNFLWIKRGESQVGNYIFPASNEETLMENYLKHILQWGYINTQGATINIWYDGLFTTEVSVTQTEAVLRKLIEGKKDFFPRVLFRDIRGLSLIKENQNIFSVELPLYFRVDLSKQMILLHMIEEERGSYAVFCDIDMDAISKEDLFDRRTLALLHKYGVVMAHGGAHGFENGFQMISDHNKHLLEAIRHAVIDLNLERGKLALLQKFFSNSCGRIEEPPFKPLQEIIYGSLLHMFSYFYSLEGFTELIGKDGTPYDRTKDKFSTFGLNSFRTPKFNIISDGLNDLLRESKDVARLPVPTKEVPLPRAGLNYDH